MADKFKQPHKTGLFSQMSYAAFFILDGTFQPFDTISTVSVSQNLKLHLNLCAFISAKSFA